jgi:chromate transporter
VSNQGREVSLGEALRAWAYVSLNSFGGPAGQIAVIHREIVERRGWIDEKRFLHALNYCMLLPGPEAQQLATYIGWLMHGIRGGLIAGALFVLPGVIALLTLSIAYVAFSDLTVVQALFYGIKPAVIAVVAAAVVRVASRSLKGAIHYAIAAGAFVAIFFLDLPFPLVIIAAALIGVVAGRRAVTNAHGAADTDAGDDVPMTRPQARKPLLALVLGAALWVTPTVVAFAVLGRDHIFTQLTLFFSFAAVVTFGGAYAILTFIAQQAVDVYGWLTARQMVDGLGLAETTPGPLIMVVQFVAFLAAFAIPNGLDPVVAGTVGGLLVTWVTFVPSFTFIFAGAPYAEYVRRRPAASAALGGISAAVVGVIANLALWFSLQTLFAVTGELHVGPLRLHTVDLASLDVFGLGLAIASYVALTRLKWPLLGTLAVSAAVGFVYFLVFRAPAV